VNHANEMVTAFLFAWEAHTKHPRTPEKAVRKWDGKTPFIVHPAWCALTILHETTLPEELRWNGALALLYHDVPEDTTAELPPTTLPRVRELVAGLTFTNTEEKHDEIWKRGKEIVLLEAYDAVANLMDIKGLSEEKQDKHIDFVAVLLDYITRDWGNKLNIIQIGNGLIPGL